MKGENPVNSISVLPILIALAVSCMAQNASPGPAASSPGKSIGLFAYPKNQQNADQRDRALQVSRRADWG
jgi:hypothetical protein